MKQPPPTVPSAWLRGALMAALSPLAVACSAPATLPEAPLDARVAQVLARLPAGPGREVLARTCTGCHDLGGLEAFRGYYDAVRWRRLVDTMIAHGAKLDETEVTVLVDYLVEQYGPDTR